MKRSLLRFSRVDRRTGAASSVGNADHRSSFSSFGRLRSPRKDA